MLWNAIAMPQQLNTIQDPELCISQLTKLMLSISDMPPIRGYIPPNNNSLLYWKNQLFAELDTGQISGYEF